VAGIEEELHSGHDSGITPETQGNLVHTWVAEQVEAVEEDVDQEQHQQDQHTGYQQGSGCAAPKLGGCQDADQAYQTSSQHKKINAGTPAALLQSSGYHCQP